jgi:hypothetical protein
MAARTKVGTPRHLVEIDHGLHCVQRQEDVGISSSISLTELL